jgi:hypothetical protein
MQFILVKINQNEIPYTAAPLLNMKITRKGEIHHKKVGLKKSLFKKLGT